MARQPKTKFTPEMLEEYTTSLQERLGKLAAIQAGMKALKLKDLEIDYKASMDDSLDMQLQFCDDGLQRLRSVSKRGARPWDQWDK